jgi:MinD superfamily P-loop ATPase/predicted Fe-Mo cluster-binding NifX family protein
MQQLLILSGKGGTGKTTLASAFIQLSKARVYADCDVDAPNLHLIMKQVAAPEQTDYYGLPKAVIDPSICTQCGLCQENCRFDAINTVPEYQVEYFSCEGCGVCEAVCPAGAVTLQPAIAGELLLYSGDTVFSTAQLKMGSGTSGKLVTEVKKQMQSAAIESPLAIIDGSPGIGCPVIASMSGVDMVLIVAEPSISGISDMIRIIRTAETFQTKAAICINKFDINIKNTEDIELFCHTHKIPFVGRIPYDPDAVRAINQGLSIIDIDCAAGNAARAVYSQVMELLNKKEEIYMKIAVASEGTMVTEHFGHCEGFNIYEVENNQIIKSSSIPNPGHRPGFLPNYLADLGINVIISGGMGGGAIEIFNQRGIEVITGARGEAKTAAELYLQGNLQSTGSVCHEHQHHDACGH